MNDIVMSDRRETVLVAVGGNALYDKQTGNNMASAMVKAVCEHIIAIYQMGYLPIVTFGNGPQVGNLLDMAEMSPRHLGSPVTLDECVAWTQGELGYGLSFELNRQLRSSGIVCPVVAVNTTVEISLDDPAFAKPTKPVGRFITMEEAQQLYEERGWVIGPDANRGYRRMVSSPKPVSILEAPAIESLIASQNIVLCCGGGGIPVAQKNNDWVGVEAVIDKDYTSCLLAKTLKIDDVIICTEVDNVYLRFGTPEQTPLKRLLLAEAQQYANEGHFSAGSMGPKVAALMDFVANGGKRAIITSLNNIPLSLEGKAGTEIYQDVPVQQAVR